MTADLSTWQPVAKIPASLENSSSGLLSNRGCMVEGEEPLCKVALKDAKRDLRSFTADIKLVT